MLKHDVHIAKRTIQYTANDEYREERKMKTGYQPTLYFIIALSLQFFMFLLKLMIILWVLCRCANFGGRMFVTRTREPHIYHQIIPDPCLSVARVTPTCDRYKLDKKLSYRRGTARCVVSIEILPIATQQCRNYLYDKS